MRVLLLRDSWNTVKSKDSSSAEFLKCLQDQVRYWGCPTGLEADNTPVTFHKQ